MMGLISPGDLIVALDGEDTRKMSAAALTRLMAKKSRQKERKITLYSQDGF
jgi:C-terminal processing protease CtpA/Prc